MYIFALFIIIYCLLYYSERNRLCQNIWDKRIIKFLKIPYIKEKEYMDTSMKEKFFSYLTGLMSFLLIPYILTIIVNGTETALLTHSADFEICLPAIVSLEISNEYELESIKSQTVIARTNLYRKLSEEGNIDEILTFLKNTLKHTGKIIYIPDEIFFEAAENTKGEILSFDGDLKMIPYHAVSAGKTRDGEEVFHDETYSYLQSVDSQEDKDAPDYINSTYIKQQQLPELLEIEERDSAGYVVSLQADENILEGEAFRKGMGLASSNFTMQKIDGQIRFLCKGKGHGLGFSQYGGNVLAQAGENYKTILQTYFPKLKIENISSILEKSE